MKKKKVVKKVINSLIIIFTFVSCFYTVSVMSNENNVKAMEQAREDVLLLSEAYKWIDEEDIDPKTGKLKEGVIYNIGENGRAYTSEGFKQFDFIDVNREIAPLVEYKTGGEVAYINYVQNRNEILFSNNFMVDFDITYDESNLNIEKKKYELVKTEYKQSSYQDKRTRLVMKSKKVKVGWIKITVWYPAIETYYETIIVNTPHNTYKEVVQHVGSISLEDNANVLTKLTANAVDKYFPDVRKMSNEYNIPLLIMFMDSVVGKVVNVIKQLLSMIADFIPVLDEIKTSFETVKGYDMFTGESIGTFWRIFGAVTLVVSLVVSFVSFGAGGIAIDAAADAAQFAKKSAKFADNSRAVANATESLSDGYKSIRKLDGLQDLGGDALKYASKNIDEVKEATEIMSSNNVKAVLRESATGYRKMDSLQITVKKTSKVDDLTSGTKSMVNQSDSITKIGNTKIDSDLVDNFRKPTKSSGIGADDFKNKTGLDTGKIIDNKTGNMKGADLKNTFDKAANNEVIPTGPTSKTFDLYDVNSKELVSNKSLHTNAETYVKSNKSFEDTVRGYLDDITDVNEYSRFQNKSITGIESVSKAENTLKGTRLDLYVNSCGLDNQKVSILKDLMREYSKKGVNFIVYVVD